MRQNFCQALVRRQVLKRHHAAVGESHHLTWIRNTERSRIEEWIVERVAEEYEVTAPVVMRSSSCDADSGISQAIAETRAVRSVGTIVWVIRIRRVINVNPGFCRMASHVRYDFLIGRTPCEPNSVSRHSRANLALADQRPVSCGETLVKVGMIRNSRFWC